MKRLLTILFLSFFIVSSGQTTKDFTFATTAEGWTYTIGGDETGVYDGTEQALDGNVFGRNKLGTGYWEWTGTWEDLGVPSGNDATAVTMDFDWSCYIANVSDGYTTGASELRNSDGTVLIGTFSSGAGGSGTTAYATQSGSEVSVGATYQSSGTTIKLRIGLTVDNANDASAETGVYYDDVSLSITNEAGSTRRIFLIN